MNIKSIIISFILTGPQIPSSQLKHHLEPAFKDETSLEKLATFTCACCAKRVSIVVSLNEFDLTLLCRPDRQHDQHMSNDYFDVDCPLPQLPFSESDGPLHNLMVDPSRMRQSDDGEFKFFLCSACHKKINKGKQPALSLANRTFLGDVPDELKNLIVVKEAMIACCQAKCWIIQLKEENQDLQFSTSQCGIKGHIIIYPQCLQGIANILPPNMANIITLICAIFVCSCPPSHAWLKEKAKPLIARREKVRVALVWLKKQTACIKIS